MFFHFMISLLLNCLQSCLITDWSGGCLIGLELEAAAKGIRRVLLQSFDGITVALELYDASIKLIDRCPYLKVVEIGF